MVLVSAVVANHNQARFLQESIPRIVQQFDDLELIVVDGASTDNSPQIIERLAREFSQVKPLFQSKDEGIAATHNDGIRKAAGKYMALLQADDLWYSDKLTTQVEFLEANPTAIATYCDADLIGVAGHKLGQTWSVLHPAPPATSAATMHNALLHNCFIQVSMIMTRAAATRDILWDGRLRSFNDWLYFIQLALRGPVHPDPVVRGGYRVSASTFRRDPRGMARDLVEMERLLAPDADRFDPSDYRAITAGAILGHMTLGNTAQAFSALLSADAAIRRRLVTARFVAKLALSAVRVRGEPVLSRMMRARGMIDPWPSQIPPAARI